MPFYLNSVVLLAGALLVATVLREAPGRLERRQPKRSAPKP
jgi:hypothetical protein